MVTEIEAKRIGTTTVTGKLMTSERVEREFSPYWGELGKSEMTYTRKEQEQYGLPVFLRSEFRDHLSRIERLEGTITSLQSKVDDLYDIHVRQQESLDNQHRLILLCLSMLQVLHPSQLHQGLKAHPDNLATMVHLGLEPESKS